MSIIGDGDLAQTLKEVDREDIIFFASGVSNSLETRDSEFSREKDLLFTFADEKEKRIVYFSTLSIFYKNSPYTKHKKRMERYVKMWPKYVIIRLGNIAWGKNPNTLINYLKDQKAKNQKLDIQDTNRYIVEKDEFLNWIKSIPDFNCELNITGQKMTVQEIVNKYVNT